MFTSYDVNKLLYLCSQQKELVSKVNIEIMKYLKFMRLMPVAFALTVLITACSTQDVYEPDPVVPEIPEEPTVPSVDIDWQTYATTVLNVDVNDAYNGVFYYTVEVYADSPIGNENARMIAGSGQKTNSKVAYSREIVVPAGVETVYVAVTDPFKRRSIYSAEITGGTTNLNLGVNNVSTKSVVSGGLRADTTPAIPEVDYTVPADAIELTGTTAIRLTRGASYIIPKGKSYTGAITFPGDNNYETKLYVEGTLTPTGSFSMEQQAKMYVYNGGSVTTNTTITLTLKQDALIAVEKGATFGSNTGTINLAMNNNSSVINHGVFVANTLDLKNFNKFYNTNEVTFTANITQITNEAVLVNKGTITGPYVKMTATSEVHNDGVLIFDQVISEGAQNTIINNNRFEIGDLSLKNCNFYNNCYLKVDKFEGKTDGMLQLSPSGYVYARELIAGGFELNMDQGSMWEGETATFSGQSSRINGIGQDYALLRVPTLYSSAGNKLLTFAGMVEIEGEYNKVFFNLNAPARFADGQASVTIEPSECNGGSGNNNPGEGDGDTDNEYQEGETLPYTYMFEDNWPATGDYDMNDVVMAVELRNTTSGAKTQSTQVFATLYAVGGTKVLGAGFQLDGIRASSVNGGEAGQDYAVFRLFNDAHATLGGPSGTQLNTYRVDYEPQVIETEVVYSTPIDGMINASNFNLFLVLGGDFDQDKRNEVHLPGFKGTNKASTNANSTADYIDVETGWMWGLAIAQTEFATYPKEGVKIYDAYQGFDTWVAGSDTPDWYYFPVEGNVIAFE